MQLSEALQQLSTAHGKITRMDVSQIYSTADGRWILISPQGKVSTCRASELDSSTLTVNPEDLTADLRYSDLGSSVPRITHHSGPGKWVGGSGDAKD